MSIIIDRSFLLRISPKLSKFARKKDDLYNFRCPVCGDSQKNKSKTRGYVYRKKNDYFFMCHNCHAGMSFYNFLSHVDDTLCQEYTLERYKLNSNYNSPEPDFSEAKSKPTFKQKIDLPSIESLPTEHFAKQYVMNRKIPESFYNDLYYTDNFKQFVLSFGIEKDLYDNEKRLVIPFYDKEKNLTGFQGRALNDSKIRYITIRLKEDVPRVFGVDRIDEEKPIYVVEGPIDAMFLDNAVAVSNSNLSSITQIYDKSKVILVFDNEPRNAEIVKLMDKAVDEHFNMVIWPEMIDEKDINDMILNGYTKEELHDIIEGNTYINLGAKLQLMNWKKV